MLEAATDLTLSFADRYGVVVLLVAFVLEGALVGKLLPTRALLIAVVLAAGTSMIDYATVFAVAVLGATTGQLLLFLAVRHLEFDPSSHERVPLREGHVDRADRWFGRWGPAAVAISNVLPVARGTMTVPTAMGRVSAPRFATYSLVGSCCYVGALVAVALGAASLIPADLVETVLVLLGPP